MNTEEIAKVCHQVNKAYCESIADNSQKNWEDATQWQKESAIKGVEFIANNKNAPESASHDSWLAEKERSGWKYGKIKDEVEKTHPCFVPYDKLPTEQKSKDYIFKSIVISLLN